MVYYNLSIIYYHFLILKYNPSILYYKLQTFDYNRRGTCHSLLPGLTMQTPCNVGRLHMNFKSQSQGSNRV